jgi:hyaluronoglucosaminidase
VLAACHEWGMTDYVYAPKDDPKHRTEWRAPYTDAELADFAELAKSGTLRLGFGISPGL